MKKKMIAMALLSLAGLILSVGIYAFSEVPAFFSAAVTFGTIFYHLAMRLAVGLAIDAKYHNRMNYRRKWFAEKSFERALYKKLQVKKWKKHMPTFTPEEFDLKTRTPLEILQVTCQAEVVHEINMVLSFVPILSSVWFGSFWVFLATSCAAFVFDGMLVILQRYNRPRLARLIRSS